ncbi:hypothetical protein B7463_g12638, partial [Scytalidium lignicola]
MEFLTSFVDYFPLNASESQLRPTTEFLNIKQLSIPPNYPAFMSRLYYNLRHFKLNYAITVAALGIWSLLRNRNLLLAVISASIGILGIQQPNKHLPRIAGFSATYHHICTAFLALSVPLILNSKVMPSLIWLIGASSLSILGHSTLMEKPYYAHTALFRNNTAMLMTKAPSPSPSPNYYIENRPSPYQLAAQNLVRQKRESRTRVENNYHWGPYPIREDIAVAPANFLAQTEIIKKKENCRSKFLSRGTLRRIF